jgi:hypothetical protein
VYRYKDNKKNYKIINSKLKWLINKLSIIVGRLRRNNKYLPIWKNIRKIIHKEGKALENDLIFI